MSGELDKIERHRGPVNPQGERRRKPITTVEEAVQVTRQEGLRVPPRFSSFLFRSMVVLFLTCDCRKQERTRRIRKGIRLRLGGDDDK